MNNCHGVFVFPQLPDAEHEKLFLYAQLFSSFSALVFRDFIKILTVQSHAGNQACSPFFMHFAGSLIILVIDCHNHIRHAA